MMIIFNLTICGGLTDLMSLTELWQMLELSLFFSCKSANNCSAVPL